MGYVARHARGRMGFLKAFDYAAALSAEDPARELEVLTSVFNAERDLLDFCRGRSLTRIVRALSWGTVRVEGPEPSAVSYLILELAERDSRDVLGTSDPGDCLIGIELMHNATAATAQLHGVGVAHQDVKPSNLLVFPNSPRRRVAKLGDLGCAFKKGTPSPFDGEPVPGDPTYAAPEQLYDGFGLVPESRRRFLCDLYMLGNLFGYLLTRVIPGAMLYLTMDQTQHWKQWGGTFAAVLPALIDAHGAVLARIAEALHSAICDEAVAILGELCHPDPRLRGDPVARRRGQNPAQLHRYISRLDLLYRRMEYASR